MSFTLADVDFRVDLPAIPDAVPVAVHSAPCTKDRTKSARALAELLDFRVEGHADVPHGYVVGSSSGQVEVFSASGAVRARNTDRLSAFDDERRRWADVDRTDDGWVLGRKSTSHLTDTALSVLERAGLRDEHAGIDVVLGQWALLDDAGAELESGPGRATVRLSYAAEGIPLIGPGAKTNLHFDPSDDGVGGVVARMFHVRRAVEASRDVPTQSLEEAFEPLLHQTWAGLEVDSRTAKIAITKASFGLLALPADVTQGFAAPALAVEGELSGGIGRDGREFTVRFGQYLPLAHAKMLADAGFASAGPAVAGQVVKGRARGK